MGCDIHAYIQFSRHNSTRRLKLDIDRNYTLFATLAGVRNDPIRFEVEPIVAQRGLPDQLDWFIKSEYEEMMGDAHSASWLTLEEVRQVQGRYAGVLKADESWYQSKAPEAQPVPEGAHVLGPFPRPTFHEEWLVEVGERQPCGESKDLSIAIVAMEEMARQGGKPLLVFWFDN